MKAPLFSILIANYNNGHFFVECYTSIKVQTYKNLEIIIVDDCSTDNSVELIKEIIKDDDQCQLFLNGVNYGCGYTKNRCANLATGEVAGFVDPDDTIKPEAIFQMIEAHKMQPDAALITSRYSFVDMRLNPIKDGSYSCAIPIGASYLTYGKGALSHFATFKNTFYKNTEGIEPIMKRAVDQDLYYKMEEVGAHFFLDEILYNYRINENSISANDNIHKAEYWHLYAKVKAYHRRIKSSNKVKNLQKEEIQLLQSNFYIARFEQLKFTDRRKAKLFLLWSSLKTGGTQRLLFKLKSVVLVLIGRI